MKALQVFGLFLFLGFFIFTHPSLAASETFNIDPVHSSILFRVKHLNVSYFFGRFNEMAGVFTFDSENPTASLLRLEVNTESIDTNNKNRDNHLKGPDFFSAKQFPTMTFKSTTVEKTDTLNQYKVTGELTLHGVSKEVTVDIEHTGSGKANEKFGYRSGFLSTFTIKRSDFGMNYMEGLLGEEIQITVSLEGTLK
ncbi:MAG: YceI family protein [Planctomycetota bacterium]